MTSSKPNALQSSHLQTLLPWGLGLKQVNFGEHKHLVCNREIRVSEMSCGIMPLYNYLMVAIMILLFFHIKILCKIVIDTVTCKNQINQKSRQKVC